MKILRKILLPLLFTSILLTSCEKYLDIKRTNLQNPINNANDLQLLLDNVSVMNTDLPSDMNLSMDDYYVDNDRYLASNVTNDDRDKYVWSINAIRASSDTQWQRPYFIIYHANLILEYIDKFSKNDRENQDVLNRQKASALFFRAWCHWQIAQMYAKQYESTTANQDLGIPLRLSSDINEKITRSTLQQTYDSILQDLQNAVPLLPTTVFVSSQPSRAAGYAMLARVYQSMENYSQALSSATSSLQLYNQLIDFNTISKTAVQPFNIYNKEVLFHSATIVAPLLNPGTESGPIAKIDPTLSSSYSPNDLRGQLYIKANSGSSHLGTYRFTGNYSFSTVSALFNGLAVDEVYLIKAECGARTGNVSQAMGDLNTLLRTRWATGSYVDMTSINADDALQKILTERRKELLMRGMRWSDLRRLNKDPRFSKTITRTVQGNTYMLPPNDNRYVLLIPNDVIQQNPNIIQNIR